MDDDTKITLANIAQYIINIIGGVIAVIINLFALGVTGAGCLLSLGAVAIWLAVLAVIGIGIWFFISVASVIF